MPWPWDVRIAKALQIEYPLTIGQTRGHTIGSYRGTLIGQMRGKSDPLGTTQGFMLLPQGDGALMVAKKQTSLENLYPATAEYDSAPVYRERTFQFRPTGGMGESTQSSATSRRYHYAINCWITGGLWGKGPASHRIDPVGRPPATTEADIHRMWAEGPGAGGGGTTALYFISHGAVWRRDGDDNAQQLLMHTRAGFHPLDMARWTGAFSGALDSLYVSWSDGDLEEYNGSVWTTANLPANFACNFLCVIGDELWAADAARSIVRKCTADPKIGTSWSGPILIGTPSVPITAIRQSSGQLAIFKADGRVFVVTAAGGDNDLFPGLSTTPSADNGRTAAAWLGSLWFRASRAFYQLDLAGTPTLSPKGPGRNLGNLSEVRGPVQAFAGWNTQMAFAGIYNESVGHSYLLSYGSWVPKADPSGQATTVSGTAYTFIDQYDGAIVRWKNRRITSMFVSNVPTEARLYCGFADGSYDWIHLVPYPLLLGDTGGDYTMDESFIVLPLHHALFQSDDKHWTGASIFGPRLGQANRVTLSYRVMARAAGAPAVGGAFQPWGDILVQNGSRSNPYPPIAGKALELRVDLTSSDETDTPVMEGLGLHERLVPAFRRDWSFTVNANDFVARRDGASTRQSGRTVRQWMETAASAPASITVELPDETVNEVALFQYEERQVPHMQRGGLGMAIAVQATQFRTIEVYGTIGRTRGTLIGDTRGFAISDMRYF